MISETISYQGGLVCQALMTFHGRARKLILDDLFELEREQLKAIFDSTPGSYLLEKMGATIPEKKFIEHIKKLPIDEIAFGKSGSRELDLTVLFRFKLIFFPDNLSVKRILQSLLKMKCLLVRS